MNKKFGIPIFESLEDAIETVIRFKFQPPGDLEKIIKAYLTIDNDGFGVLRYSFEGVWGLIGERFDAHKLNVSNRDFVVKNESEELNLTNLFREMNLEKKPFVCCKFTRHGPSAYDTLNSRSMVNWFVLEYNSESQHSDGGRKMRVLINDELKKIFPEYEVEIEELAGIAACGCAGCTLNTLRQRHPTADFTLPEEWTGLDVIVV